MGIIPVNSLLYIEGIFIFDQEKRRRAVALSATQNLP